PVEQGLSERVEDTEWRPVEGLSERGQWRDWQRGVEDTEWRPVEGLAEGGGRTPSGGSVEGLGREGREQDTERLVRWMSLAAEFRID
ncbi:unnamed protein product, partial [Staurois parvus]